MSDKLKLGYTMVPRYPKEIIVSDINLGPHSGSIYDWEIRCNLTVETLTEDGKKL